VKHFNTALFAAMILLLTGCETVNPISADNDYYPPGFFQSPVPIPRIIPGQKAVIYGAFDATRDAWAETGLFASVTHTENKVPSLDGVYISWGNCYYGRVRSFPVLGGLTVFLITLGGVSNKSEWDTTCHTTIYQNGEKIVDSVSGWHNSSISGIWGPPLMNIAVDPEKQRLENQRDFSALAVRKALFDLSKSNP
jgi:hypothetical protein